MTKLKLSAIPDDRPVKITAELSGAVHRDLVAYAELLGRETGDSRRSGKLIAPMLTRFMATDRAFAKARRTLKGGMTIRVIAAVRTNTDRAGTR
ncbi:DUF2274 domain-containing protein [Mesorhizobium sp. M1307]|uniref:DUF2274 domain-containing protein n=1 Tax=Mesorhizobium sp. M1307 TaxID=2957079 RepID=UPI0033350928